MGLLDQVHVVEGARIVRVEPDGLFQFDFGLIELAHFVKQLAVPHQCACFRLVIGDIRNLLHRRIIGHFAAHGSQQPVVAFLERQSGGILRVHFQHAVDLRGGFVQITLTLCLTGERKPGGSQAGNGQRRFVALMPEPICSTNA